LKNITLLLLIIRKFLTVFPQAFHRENAKKKHELLYILVMGNILKKLGKVVKIF